MVSKSAEITNTDLVAAKFEIEKANTKIVGTPLSHIIEDLSGWEIVEV